MQTKDNDDGVIDTNNEELIISKVPTNGSNENSQTRLVNKIFIF